jgi:N,N'-diacetyllegionaminate synthase
MKFIEKLRESDFYFIAEGADAHYGDMKRAKSMIDAAKKSGADAIKFQHHIPEEEMLRETPMSSNMSEPLFDFLLRNALTITQHVELAEYCESVGIQYLCTPFSLTAARELEEHISLPAYKIGSGELLDHPTIREIAKFDKCMIISTGMSTPEEIDTTYEILKNHPAGLVMMNCTSAYPPRYEDIHLKFIEEMRTRYPNAVLGFSDHSPGTETVIASFTLGAKVIEKHVTLSHDLEGPDATVSINFDTLSILITSLKRLALAFKSKKEIHQSELEIRNWAHRSLVYLRAMKSGEVIAPSDIWGKRPGYGVPSFKLNEFIGRRLAVDVEKNTLLTEKDFE